MIPGEYKLQQSPLHCNEGRKVNTVSVLNRGDRPIQVGSHFHFYETNNHLSFSREQALGRHLNIPAGTAVRFEPGDEKEVDLVPYTGERTIYGFRNEVNGPLQEEK